MNPVGESGPLLGLITKSVPGKAGGIVFSSSTLSLFKQNVDMGPIGLIIFLVIRTGLKSS